MRKGQGDRERRKLEEYGGAFGWEENSPTAILYIYLLSFATVSCFSGCNYVLQRCTSECKGLVSYFLYVNSKFLIINI